MSEKKIGYARTAVVSDEINKQIERLKAAGCTEVYSDSGTSGIGLERPSLAEALARLQAGDTLVVCHVNRLSRSNRDIIDLVDKLMHDGIEFEAVDEPDLALALQHQVNYAPDPSRDKSIIRYAIFRLGAFLVRYSRLGLITFPRR